MPDTSVTGASQTTSTNYATTAKSLQNLDVSDFIKMLVAELQHQDPMQPMTNAEMLQQVSQIKSIQSNDKLSSTLDGLALAQNVANAGSLLQRKIEGIADNGQKVKGVVDQVSIADGVATLHVGKQSVSLKNVSTILPN
jgi:flagellar basal-body rod modification protein FlgD